MSARIQLRIRRVEDAAAAERVRDLLARAKARALGRTLANQTRRSDP